MSLKWELDNQFPDVFGVSPIKPVNVEFLDKTNKSTIIWAVKAKLNHHGSNLMIVTDAPCTATEIQLSIKEASMWFIQPFPELTESLLGSHGCWRLF